MSQGNDSTMISRLESVHDGTSAGFVAGSAPKLASVIQKRYQPVGSDDDDDDGPSGRTSNKVRFGLYDVPCIIDYEQKQCVAWIFVCIMVWVGKLVCGTVTYGEKLPIHGRRVLEVVKMCGWCRYNGSYYSLYCNDNPNDRFSVKRNKYSRGEWTSFIHGM